MTEIKTVYSINQLDLSELNRTMAKIAERLDKLEGLRGTPRFYSAPDMGGNKITNTEQGTASGEVLASPLVITKITAEEIWAASSAGLSLFDDAGNQGIFVDDGGFVTANIYPIGSILLFEDLTDPNLEGIYGTWEEI